MTEPAPEDVYRFYAERGWRRTATGAYLDTDLFVDTRPVMAAYRARSRARLKALLAGTGRYFLDAASGANPAIEYSHGYRWHVCVDFTQAALSEARLQTGARGLYVRADLARLPFRAGSVQAMFSAHTLYHLPPEAQHAAVHELARCLAPGAPGVIVYTSAGLQRLGRWLRRRLGGTPASRPGLWVMPRAWLSGELSAAGLRPRVRVHQVLHHALTRRLVPDNRLGAALLRALAWLEGALPGPLARVGYMLLFVVRR
jgi:SAM-dependent methyltransferase